MGRWIFKVGLHSHVRAGDAELELSVFRGQLKLPAYRGPLGSIACSERQYLTPPKAPSGLPELFHCRGWLASASPFNGRLHEVRDHMYLCIPRGQHGSWHRGGVGGGVQFDNWCVNGLSEEGTAVEGNEPPIPEGTRAGVLWAHGGVGEIPVPSRCPLGTLSTLHSSFPGPESFPLGSPVWAGTLCGFFLLWRDFWRLC